MIRCRKRKRFFCILNIIIVITFLWSDVIWAGKISSYCLAPPADILEVINDLIPYHVIQSLETAGLSHFKVFYDAEVEERLSKGGEEIRCFGVRDESRWSFYMVDLKNKEITRFVTSKGIKDKFLSVLNRIESLQCIGVTVFKPGGREYRKEVYKLTDRLMPFVAKCIERLPKTEGKKEAFEKVTIYDMVPAPGRKQKTIMNEKDKKDVEVTAKVKLGALKPEQVKVEIHFGLQFDSAEWVDTEMELQEVLDAKGGVYLFKGIIQTKDLSRGRYGFTTKISLKDSEIKPKWHSWPGDDGVLIIRGRCDPFGWRSTREGRAHAGRSEKPIIYELNARCLGRKFSEITDSDIAKIAERYNYIWMMGIWQESQFSKKLNQYWDPEREASSYSIPDYKVNPELGGEDEFEDFVERCNRLGLKVIIDFVPNHMSADSPWIDNHPDWFIQAPPSTSLPGDPIQDPGNPYFCYIRTDGTRGPVVAHGRDPNYGSWKDTAQLNLANEELRAHMIEVLKKIGRLTKGGGVRCDMVNLTMRLHIWKIWYSHLKWEEFERLMPREFWEEVIKQVKKEYPDILFIAESYHGEGYLQTKKIGFDYVYDDKTFTLLKSGNTAGLKERLSFKSKRQEGYFTRSLHYLSNHDVGSAKDNFGEREFAAAMLTATLPGGLLIPEGQEEGFRESMSAEWVWHSFDRKPDDSRQRFYEELLDIARDTLFMKGGFNFVNTGSQDIIAFLRKHEDKTVLVMANYSEKKAMEKLGIRDISEISGVSDFVLSDYMHADRDISGNVMLNQNDDSAIFCLDPWEVRIFKVTNLYDAILSHDTRTKPMALRWNIEMTVDRLENICRHINSLEFLDEWQKQSLIMRLCLAVISSTLGIDGNMAMKPLSDMILLDDVRSKAIRTHAREFINTSDPEGERTIGIIKLLKSIARDMRAKYKDSIVLRYLPGFKKRCRFLTAELKRRGVVGRKKNRKRIGYLLEKEGVPEDKNLYTVTFDENGGNVRTVPAWFQEKFELKSLNDIFSDPDTREYLLTAMWYVSRQFGVSDRDIEEFIRILVSSLGQNLNKAAEDLMAFVSCSSFIRVTQYYGQIRNIGRRSSIVSNYVTGPVVADIGCGSGVLAQKAIQSTAGVEKIIGTDVRPYSEITDPRFEFREQKVPYEIPIESNSVDTVVLSFVLHHVDPELHERFLKEVFRILKPGGRVIVLEDTYSNAIKAANETDLLRQFLTLNPRGKRMALGFNDWLIKETIRNDSMNLPFAYRSMEEWMEIFERMGFAVDQRHTEFIGIFESSISSSPRGILLFNKAPDKLERAEYNEQYLKDAINTLVGEYGPGILSGINKIEIVDRKGPVGSQADSKAVIDIDTFRDKNLVLEVLEHGALYEILELLLPGRDNGGLKETVATLASVKRFLKLSEAERRARIELLRDKSNGLDPGGKYAGFLESILTGRLSEDDLIKVVISFVEANLDIKVVRDAKRLLDDGLDLLDDFSEADKLVNAVKETEKQAVRVAKTFGDSRIAGKCSDKVRKLAGLIVRYEKWNIPETSKPPAKKKYIVVYNKRMKEEFTGIAEELKKHNIEVIDNKAPEGVDPKDIVILVDPEDVNGWRDQKDKNLNYLPLPYMELSLKMAAGMVLNNGEIEKRSPIYNFVKNFYEVLLGLGRELSEGEVLKLFTEPWVILPDVEVLSKDLAVLRDVISSLGESA